MVHVDAETFEALEPLDHYEPGGFHPVSIGDTFHDGRYQVLHRLGHGAYSTVWLAENLHYKTTASTVDQPPDIPAVAARYVAIKIFAADTPADKLDCCIRRSLPQAYTKGVIAAITEIVSSLADLVLSYVQKPMSSTGEEFVVSLLEEFKIDGPNGEHNVVVMDLVGPSTGEVMRCRELSPLPVEIGRLAVAQCAKGLAYLHSIGLVHGDLHPGNLAFALPNLDSLSVEELYNCIGEPQHMRLDVLDDDYCCYEDSDDSDSSDDEVSSKPSRPTRPVSPHEPPYLIVPPSPARLWSLCTTPTASNPDLPRIRILDFTESFRPPIRTPEVIPGTPERYASPELILSDFLPHSEITPSIDIWAFACTAFRLLGDENLFIMPFGTRAEVLADMIVARREIEAFPERYWKVFWERLRPREWFTQDGGLVEGGTRYMWSWDMKIRMMGGDKRQMLKQEDEGVLRKIMRVALRFEPERRATAEEIVAMIPASWESMDESKELK